MIQTRGFQVSVLPQYASVDPRLVALRPDLFMQGVGQTIDLANALANRKAFLAEQAEKEATRATRIEATNAGNKALTERATTSIPTFAPAAKLSIARSDAGLVALPHTTAATIAEADAAASAAPYKAAETIAKSVEGAASAGKIGAAERAQAELNKEQAELDQLLVQEREAFLRANPQATAEEMQAKMLTNRAVLAKAQAIDKIKEDLAKVQAEAAVEEAKAVKSIAETTQKWGYRPSTNVLPGGVTYERELEKVAARLGMATEQVRSLAGTPVGAAIIGKLSAATRGGIQVPLTAEERAVYNSMFVPKRPEAKAPVEITTEEEFNKLEKGAPFIYKGRAGTKK